MLPYIYAWVFVALTAPGVIVAIRALPWVERKMMAGVKPWACDICMSFWTVAWLCSIAAALLGDWRFCFTAGPAYSSVLWLLGQLQKSQPPPGAIPLPPLTPLADTLEPKDPKD